jgi:anion-transporting  ArsA/GET3 family ATPase
VNRRPPGVAALAAALESRRVLVVCGSGGVGKTTTAAALALHAALAGRRALVCTIDPARRLATSLGLARLAHEPRALSIGRLNPRPGGSLSAMMLDTKRTFDALVERYTHDTAARDRILGNRFYQQVSSTLSGSHEYMAMEKLLDLVADPRWDVVVLDTPPTRHALDFLEAPDRMLAVLDGSILRYLVRPYFAAGRLTLKIATRTGALALRLADRFLGMGFLEELSDFLRSFEGMYDGFKERAARVHSLLRDESSGFVLVASPARATLDEARYLHGRLREKEMPFVSVVVNRVHPDPADLAAEGTPGRPPARRADVDGEFARRLRAVCREQQALADADRRSLRRIEVDLDEPVVIVPELEADVHDLRGLGEVARAMLGEPRRAGAAAAGVGVTKAER